VLHGLRIPEKISLGEQFIVIGNVFNYHTGPTMEHRQPNNRPALLVLEDGTTFPGQAFGAEGERTGEVVFNTSMAGYQEITTDPSYCGQIVVMTYPLIGNYGANPEDVESRKPWVEGFAVREISPLYSNWRAVESLGDFLAASGVTGISGIDTRALTRHIRSRGAMRGIISTVDLDTDSLHAKALASPGLVGRDLVREVTCEEPYCPDLQGERRFRVAVVDCGVKKSILSCLAEVGCDLTVYPASTTAEAILAAEPDGVFLSNGPGDPEGVPYLSATVRSLLGKVPLFGICLGHQMLSLALGAKSYKLKFGHRGGNHPVRDERTRRIAITVQNHGFCIDPDSLDQDVAELTHVNLYDGTVEGIRHRTFPAFSVQYHPEASPGPHDARYLFDEFRQLMEENSRQ
jgi:carbamoyl-phosphate synthase small subunit